MSLLISRPGIFDTLQDSGRTGYASYGVNVNGSMDPYASQVANALVGNLLHEAVLEMHFPAPEIVFEENALISMTGADFSPAINGREVPLWRPVAVSRHAKLSFKGKRHGQRCYLAVHGGFEIPRWLESYSTNTAVGAGGFHGRVLRKDDNLPFGPATFSMSETPDTFIFPWSVNANQHYFAEHIAFTEGAEWSWLSSESQDDLINGTVRVEPKSDRMGYFLVHEPLAFAFREELISSAVSFGTIQALPSGQMIVLMADHQTTGGYPRIGHVASAHLPRLAQISPRQEFRFRRISLGEAENIVLSLQHEIRMISQSCREKLNTHYGN